MGGGRGSISKIKPKEEEEEKLDFGEDSKFNVSRNPDGKIKTVKQIVTGMVELRQKAEIEKYRQQMNPEPSKAPDTSVSGGTATNTASLSKSNGYNRNSKRGTRLVKVVNNG